MQSGHKFQHTNWDRLFGHKSVDEMGNLFTETFLQIVNRHIPSRDITVDDKDAPWVTLKVKAAIGRNKSVYKKVGAKG